MISISPQRKRILLAQLAAVCVLSLLWLALPPARHSLLAQVARFGLNWWTVDGGGGSSAGRVFGLSGTVGQPDASLLRSNRYTLAGGFWPGIAELATPTPTALPTSTSTSTVPATETAMPTSTHTATATTTATATETATQMATAIATATHTPMATASNTPLAATSTPTPSSTATTTTSPSVTASPTSRLVTPTPSDKHPLFLPSLRRAHPAQ